MPDLYNVSFTTKKLIKRYDQKGKMIGETALENPITMTMLPHSTAMSYSGCDNFKIEPYVSDQRGVQASRGVGNGTKKVDWSAAQRSTETSGRKVKTSKPAETATQRAARTGDMASAING